MTHTIAAYRIPAPFLDTRQRPPPSGFVQTAFKETSRIGCKAGRFSSANTLAREPSRLRNGPRRVHLRCAIDLTREDGTHTEDAAGLLRLDGTDAGGFFVRLAFDARLSASQVQAENIVVRGAAGHRPAGAGLRVIGMRAGNHDAQPTSGGLRRIGEPEPRG